MDNLRERLARLIYVEVALQGDEQGNRDHLAAVFGEHSRADYQTYGARSRKAADAVLAELRKDADAHPQPDQGKDLAQALMASEIVTWLAENPPSAPTASEEYLNGLNDAHRLILSAMSVLASKAWEKLPADVQLAEDPVAALYASKDNRHAD